MTVKRLRFTGPLDTSVWTVAQNWGGFTPDVDVIDGCLNMTTRFSGKGYTACRVDTHGKLAVKPGSYVEFRAKLPTASGVFPGLFLVGAAEGVGGRTWPGVGEIDVVEVAGNPSKAKANLISTNAAGARAEVGWPNADTPVANLGDWHTYGVYFDSGFVQFSIDRVNTYRFDRATAPNSMGWPFGDPTGFYLALTFSVGGVGGDPAATFWPQVLQVSGIDVYSD